MACVTKRPIVIVSNRGPVSFRWVDDDLVAHRGAGGLVSGLAPLMREPDRQWIAAALNDVDRAAIAADPDSSDFGAATRSLIVDGVAATLVAVDAADLAMSYDMICNRTLWYLHHHLFDLAREPIFGDDWFAAWDAYRRVNEVFADLVVDRAPPGAVVLVQDYHLGLVGSMVAARRVDLATVHFSHTPFANPTIFDILPSGPRRELLKGMAGHDACGFHTRAWRDAFARCCEANDVAAPHTFVAPLGPDAADLHATTQSEACRAARERLEDELAGQLVIARSDRIELSKNLIRGFLAFETLLEREAQWRGRVTFAASIYPSRESNPDYVSYRRDLERTVTAINAKWATSTWTPIVLDETDNYPLSLAMLARADVVFINPIRDGLNLVAKEAMLVNERDALLALSPAAGAWDELSEVAFQVDPFDVRQCAQVLHELLSTDPTRRADLAQGLRKRAGARTPALWLHDQLDAVHDH